MSNDLRGVGAWSEDFSSTDLLGTDFLGDEVLSNGVLKDGVLSDDFSRNNSFDSSYARPTLFIDPQNLTSEPLVPSFSRSEGLPDASSSTFRPHTDFLSNKVLSNGVLSDDFSRNNSFDNPHARPTLFIDPQNLTSEPSVPSFSRSEGLPDASSSTFGPHTDFLGNKVLSNGVLSDDFSRNNSFDSPYARSTLFIDPQNLTSEPSVPSFSRSESLPDASSSTFRPHTDFLGNEVLSNDFARPTLFIDPQNLTSEPSVPSFSRSEGLPDASSSTFGPQSSTSGYLQDYLEQQERKEEARLRNACQSNELHSAYPGYPHQSSIYKSLSNQKTNQSRGLEASANPDVAYDSSRSFQPQSETEIAIHNEDLALGGPSLRASHENNEIYSVDHASPIPNPPNWTSKARRRDSAGDPIPCQKCDKSFLHRYKYNKHVKTHDRTLRCGFPNCSSSGFYRLQDKRRHELSCEKGFIKSKEFKCPFPDCEYAIEGFPRKDNCDRHIRRKHQSNAGDDVG